MSTAIMHKAARITGAITLSFCAAYTAGTMILHPAPAHAATTVNWTARTCAAERAWVKHPTAANLDTMTADSFHVAWKYVGEDAESLYHDVRSGRTQYEAKDKSYFSKDCPA